MNMHKNAKWLFRKHTSSWTGDCDGDGDGDGEGEGEGEGDGEGDGDGDGDGDGEVVSDESIKKMLIKTTSY